MHSLLHRSPEHVHRVAAMMLVAVGGGSVVVVRTGSSTAAAAVAVVAAGLLLAVATVAALARKYTLTGLEFTAAAVLVASAAASWLAVGSPANAGATVAVLVACAVLAPIAGTRYLVPSPPKHPDTKIVARVALGASWALGMWAAALLPVIDRVSPHAVFAQVVAAAAVHGCVLFVAGLTLACYVYRSARTRAAVVGRMVRVVAAALLSFVYLTAAAVHFDDGDFAHSGALRVLTAEAVLALAALAHDPPEFT